MLVKLKVKDEYDPTNNETMAQINQLFYDNNAPVSWSYNPETRIIDLEIPDNIDTSFLDEYGEIIS